MEMLIDKKYEVTLEVAGPLAMFARPDTGGTPTSYPVPTWSAAKGLFESIAFFADEAAWICPTRVEVCRRVGEPGERVRYQRYTTNYGGPHRKKALLRSDDNMQLFATVLSDVCYRLYGDVVSSRWRQKNNPRHHLQDLFNRRLMRGQCFRTPCLGWSEFTCSYWGPFREGITEVDTTFSAEIPSMLAGMWTTPSGGQYRPTFCHDVEIRNGVLEYPLEWLGDFNGKEIADAQ
jgi:CRISPR-associated protein Cas5d